MLSVRETANTAQLQDVTIQKLPFGVAEGKMAKGTSFNASGTTKPMGLTLSSQQMPV